MHAHVGVPAHSGGIGEHARVGSCEMSCTQTSSSGQSSQLGTTSHSSAGTHTPLQQLSSGSTLGRVPAGHCGGVESQVTSKGLHDTGTSSQLPSSHCATGLMPSAPQAVAKHSGRSHGGGSSPCRSAVQLQQSSHATQSLGCVQADGGPPVVESEPLPDAVSVAVEVAVVAVLVPEVSLDEAVVVALSVPVVGPLPELSPAAELVGPLASVAVVWPPLSSPHADASTQSRTWAPVKRGDRCRVMARA